MAFLVALAAALTAAPAHAATAAFTPGAAWNDTGGNPLQLHGLGIVQAGSTWYGFGEDKTGESSSNTAFQDIPCYSSADLSSWTRQGTALARQAGGDLGPGRIVERPKVLHNPTTGKYVMYMHIDNGSYSEAKVGVAVSDSACGPYTYRGSFQPLGYQSRDIGLFQDGDGTGYLLSEDRANGLRIDRLSADYLSVAAPVALLADYEAPAMVKIAGTYYLLASHLTGWSTNDNVYATAPSPAGPWSAFRAFAPTGTSTYNSQTANIITVAGSSATTYIYAADRWTTGNLGTSPLIWLPMTVSGTTLTVGWQRSWTLESAAGAWGAGASNPAGGSTHYLTNAHSGLVMDVSGGSSAPGAKVIQWTNHAGANQQWTLNPAGGNAYTLRNANSGLCLEAPGGSTAQGVQLDQGTCTGAPGQQWAFDAVGSYTSTGDTSYLMVDLGSGLAADDYGNSATAGAAVDQWPGNGGNNQTWNLS
ncbi:RICIN domain-containing protein [Actinocrinis puniceicyclus]|uniref:RICIN domain-containing protein n=1 Tax=Actinocrinis puniceicyclus TaxID=977794 RepID=A0A8J8BGN3_9ACTN|nr:RICIN domain-containing protein [Actinocrinis puniceicyclus]